MRILFMINGLGVGGAETQLIALMHNLLHRGHDIAVATINDDMRLVASLPPGVRHYPLGGTSRFAAGRVVIRFIRVALKESPDIVHAHLLQANLLSRLTKLIGSQARVVNTTHCNYGLEHRSYNPYKIYRWTKRLVDLHTAVSMPALSTLCEQGSIAEDRAKLVFNAIDCSQYNQARQDETWSADKSYRPFRWIAVGRLNPVKNYGLLLDAASRLVKEGSRFTIDIAGEGKELEKLRATVVRYSMDHVVNFLGLVHDLSERLSTYDGYVICSNNEALPMALLEAMASGLPVVGSRVGEIPSIIAKSRGGLCIGPGDVNELASAMSQVMQMAPSDRHEWGKRNRAYIEDTFGMDQIVNVWERIYSQLISERPIGET